MANDFHSNTGQKAFFSSLSLVEAHGSKAHGNVQEGEGVWEKSRRQANCTICRAPLRASGRKRADGRSGGRAATAKPFSICSPLPHRGRIAQARLSYGNRTMAGLLFFCDKMTRIRAAKSGSQ